MPQRGSTGVEVEVEASGFQHDEQDTEGACAFWAFRPVFRPQAAK